MYSKFFKNTNTNVLEQELDIFLKDLEDVTGSVVNIQMLQHDNEVTVLIIYSCWKKI